MAPVAIKPREPQLGESISPQLQAGKRPKDEHSNPTATLEPPLKVAKTSNVETIEKKHHEPVLLKTYSTSTASSAASKKARETRLEQNRKAARESRRRKKVMIEDLQRSVIDFSRANGALKHQNDELTRLLMQAQNQVAIIESSTTNSNDIKMTSVVVDATKAAEEAAKMEDTAVSLLADVDGQGKRRNFPPVQRLVGDKEWEDVSSSTGKNLVRNKKSMVLFLIIDFCLLAYLF